MPKQEIDSYKRKKRHGQRKVKTVLGYIRKVKPKKKNYIDIPDDDKEIEEVEENESK